MNVCIYMYIILSPYPELLMFYIWLHVELMDGFEGKSKNIRDSLKIPFTQHTPVLYNFEISTYNRHE